MLCIRTHRGIQGHFQGDQVVEEKPRHSVQYVGQEQVLVDRHPSTVELSVFKKFTGVNKHIYSLSEQRLLVYSIIQKGSCESCLGYSGAVWILTVYSYDVQKVKCLKYRTETSSCELSPLELC